ncbi:MAG: hypothetical protein L0Y45_07265, partial [Woeseiaceae bacterium]|nr:hypothetical protein [Woeseiaceae bacterium]
GVILLILGIPEFHLSNPHLDKGRFDEALQNLKDKQREVASAVAGAAEAETPDPAPPAEPAEMTTADVAASTEPTLTDAAQSPDESDLQSLPQERQWYSFWNPFRSEVAARGFVSQLEKVTGLDYRIVKVKTGVYEVSFAYEGDIEKQAKLSQIQAATGLELPGS